MNDDTTPDLTLLTQLMQQVLAEQAIMRDEMRTLAAIQARQDSSLAALLTGVRAILSQQSRMDSRVHELEVAASRTARP